MKKVFDQTVRDLKREVNKNVLKVPRIEQKVLDATSNEPWGPHGSLLSDIAMASRNYHEYQMIMSVVWKRINDTGKNWRHVYKALTVLEYMVAHGSERVIDEIREHAYQISTLSDFQYIDSSGRDQGSNVRKKSQSIVALVNDKDRVIEVRQKAAANKDKYRSPSSTGGMYRPGSGGYGDRYDDEGRYGGRDDDRYGKEREWGEERYGKNGDSNSRDGDRYDERYGRDDNYRGRSQSIDDNQYAQRSRSSDRERDRSVEDDGQYSSRGTKAEDSVDGSRKLDRKFSEQNIGAPPSYEEAVSDSKSPAHLERDGEAPVASIPKASPPPVVSSTPSQSTAAPETSVSPANQEVQSFDEFDPRSAFAATPPVSANNPEMDLLGSLALAIVPTETESAYVPPPTHSANQPFGDPFGDSPFKAVPSETIQPPQPPQTSTSTPDLAGPAFDFGDPLSGLTYSSVPVQASSSPNPDFLPPELSTSQQNSTDDVLANILPHQIPASTNPYANFQPQAQVGPGALVTIPQPHQSVQGNYMNHAPAIPMTSHMIPNAQFNGGQFSAPNNGSFYHQQQQSSSQAAPNNGNFYHQQQQSSQAAPNNGNFYHQQQQSSQAAPNNGNFYHPQQSQGAVNNSMGIRAPQQGGYQPPPPQPQPQSTMNNDVLGSLVPQATPAPKDKFETKSTVWADTLSRGLVNLNISGPKINPMADIGVDFDALNRRDKRMEKPVSTPVVSTVTMGKAMGSGSGIGRAGAGMGLRPAPNPMMGMGMGMGMGHYGTMNNNPMQMGMGQGPPMQPPGGSNVPGYNPMVGPGGYNPMQQQPYGGYR